MIDKNPDRLSVADDIIYMLTKNHVVRGKPVTLDSKLIDDLELDSLDVAEFSIRLEEKFMTPAGDLITITDDDLSNWTTVRDAINGVCLKMGIA